MHLALLRSSFRRNWRLDNYPIRYMQQTPSGSNTPERLRTLKWRVDIIGWYLAGTGDTKEDAYSDLQKRFAVAAENCAVLPRPGISVPIQFASDERVSRFTELRNHFVTTVLGLDWAFLSDESSLWDFHEYADNDHLIRKIGEVYGVDVSGVVSANIADILSEIMNQTGTFPEDSIVKAIRLDRDARTRHISGLPPIDWDCLDGIEQYRFNLPK